MSFSQMVKQTLLDKIHEMTEYSWLFVKKPGTDFARKRKLDFDSVMRLLLTFEGASMGDELLKFSNYSLDTPTISAFSQQRNKILPEALEYLFHEFNREFADYKTFKNYRLLACDGSDLRIAHNPDDEETYCTFSSGTLGFNLLHLNALYDLCNRRFVDAIVQGRNVYNESRAMTDMIDRYDGSENTIFMADRNYETYNIFAHAEQKNMKYLIRVKDNNSNGMLSGFVLPEESTFDIDVDLIITKQKTQKTKSNSALYKILHRTSPFDYIDLCDNQYYPITLRVLRFPIFNDTYECIITNLSRDEFCSDDIKKLYHMRWGIETSFRELKYAIGLTAFHSRKVEYILQEIFARLTLYNFCEIITTHVVVTQKKTKHLYKLNYTMAIHICRHYLHDPCTIPPPDVKALLQKFLLPIRKGRSDPRKVKTKCVVSFPIELPSIDPL